MIIMEPKLQDAADLIDSVVNDSTVPKNIRKTLGDAKQRLQASEELNVKVSAAIYLIESISDDINMPAHARTQIWAVISALESAKH